MKFRIVISEDALEDIQTVFRYIADAEGLPITAKRWLDTVEQAIQKLSSQPFLYPEYDLRIPEIPQLRKLVVGRYLVFYTIEETSQSVQVLRVISGRQDIFSEFSKKVEI